MWGYVDFGLLGPVEAWDDGQPLPLGGTLRRCVLAVLLLEAGRPVPVDRIVELVWDDNPPAAARNTVATHVSRLRKILSRDPTVSLVASGPGYTLNVDPERVDVHRFRRLVRAARATPDLQRSAQLLRQALDLWRGPALAGLEFSGLRHRLCSGLEEERRAALEERIAADLRRGRHHDVVAELVDVVAEHPLAERLGELWMLALYRCGRRADALAAYRQVRDRIRAELGIEPGPALRSLHRRVLENDPALSLPVEDRRPTTNRPVPAQLPADVFGFTGRAAELGELHRLLATAGGILLLSGTAGVGKTALAVHWAHRVRHRFSDGQLYVDLRGYDPDRPMPPGDALARFLGALGVAAQDIPIDVDERAARYRTEISDRRMLIVLDNACSVEQLRPLLPGTPSCLVVATSRDSLGGLVALHGAHRLELDLLTHRDATELLHRLIGDRVEAEPEAAGVLAEQCARLPLALRIAAELAVSRPDAPLAQLTGELADRRRRLRLLETGGDVRAAVRVVFSWSYQQLALDAAVAFRRLGLHPGHGFDQYAVAAVVAVELDHGRRLLDVLVRAHLVQPAGQGRFGMHDLLRAYANELVDPGEAQQALTRLFDFYLAAAAAAMHALHPAERARRPRVDPPDSPIPPLADPTAARAWLDAERPNLAAVCAHAAEHGWPTHAIRIATTLYRYLEGGHYTDALSIHSSALHAARLCGDQSGQAHALTNLGAAHRLLGQYKSATDHHQRAVELHKQTGDRHGEARTLSNLGIVEERLGRHDLAAVHQLRALDLYRELGDRHGEAGVLTNLGGTYIRPGHYHHAAEHLGKALVLFRELDDRVGEASALSNLGDVHTSLGRFDEAAECLHQALALFRETNHRYGQATALSNLGHVNTRLGRYTEAAGYLVEALDLFRSTGHRYGEASALNGLGEALHAAGRPAEALRHHTTALAIATETGDHDELTRATTAIARARCVTQEPPGTLHTGETPAPSPARG